MNLRIAVTGPDGQLGSELCRRLGRAALPLGRPEFELTDREPLLARLLAEKPTAVINAAAYTQVDRAEHEPERCWQVNAQAVGYLAETCRQLDCPLVQISTDYVFGGDTGGGLRVDAARRRPYREDDEPGPQGVYAQSKLAGERQAAGCERHLIVRTCGLYARPRPNAPGGNFVSTMLRLGRERRQVRVVDDQQCTPSYVPHVAAAILFLLEMGAVGTYHVTNTGATTWYDFAAEIFRRSGMPVTLERITTAEYAAAAPRPAYSVLDTQKYHALGGPPMPSWQQALAECIAGPGNHGWHG